MKKLSKLTLRNVDANDLMSDKEMKDVLGGGSPGIEGGGGCKSDCTGDCVVADGSEPHSNLIPGKCGWTLRPVVRCTCAAGYYSPYI